MSSRKQNKKNMISLNLNLEIEDYKLFTDYVDIWEKEFNETVTPENFFMSNVVYWTIQYKLANRQQKEQSKKDILDLRTALNNIFGGLEL